MYRVTFLDGSTFISNYPIDDSHWNDIPNKPIIKLEYCFGKKTLILEGYEAYNISIEKTTLLFPTQTNRTQQFISQLFILGRYGNNVLKFIVDFHHKKTSTKILPFGKEHNNKPLTGWKLGFKTSTPKSKFV